MDKLFIHRRHHCKKWSNYVIDYKQYLSMQAIPDNYESDAQIPKKKSKSFTEVSMRTEQKRKKQLLEGTSPNLMKKTAVKAIDIDNPGFEKIFKSSERLGKIIWKY